MNNPSVHSDAPGIELLDAIGDAFNNNDIDAVMEFFDQNAVFDHAAGPDEHGIRFKGAEAIRKVFAGAFEAAESIHWETLDTCISGNKAYCEYRRTAKSKTGETQVFLSVDILTFKNGLITHKDTYYKNRVST